VKVIARLPNWVGDLVLATPFVHALRDAFPDAEITVVGRRPALELIESNPFVDRIIPIRRRGITEAKNIRDQGPFDIGFVLPPSFSSAAFLTLVGAERRIGYETDRRGSLLTDALPEPVGVIHRADSYLKLIEHVIGRNQLHMAYHTEIHLTDKDFVKINDILPNLKRPLIVLNPNSEAPSRRWPPIYWIELGKALCQKDVSIILVGGPFDVTRTRRIAHEIGCDRVINLAGQLHLRELAALLSSADLVVSNDTGPMHISYTVGTKTIALFGAGDERVTGPYRSPDVAIVMRAPDVQCAPCGKNYCPLNHKRCMWELKPDLVLAKIEEILMDEKWKANEHS